MTELSVRELDAMLRFEGRFWGDCVCGRPMDRHARRTVASAGTEYVCGELDGGLFEPVTLPELDYTPQKGLHRP